MPAKLRTIAIIQARMSSSRLPGKVLLDLGGQPMLVRVVERSRRAGLLDDVVVATTREASDDAIVALCTERGYPSFRGDLSDVLDRYYQAARSFQADLIVRITADCPLMDAALLDRMIALLDDPARPRVDFAASRLPPPWTRSLPIGLDVEVVRFAALERAWREADQTFQREHVMPFFYEGVSVPGAAAARDTWQVTYGTSPRGFRVAQLHHQPDLGALRWTVDTQADLELLRLIYAAFDNQDDFTWQEVLTLFQQRPELAAINADVIHKTLYDK